MRELKRINDQNQSMLARIQNREPYYDHKKWDAERKQDLKYLNNIKSREVRLVVLSKHFILFVWSNHSRSSSIEVARLILV